LDAGLSDQGRSIAGSAIGSSANLSLVLSTVGLLLTIAGIVFTLKIYYKQKKSAQVHDKEAAASSTRHAELLDRLSTKIFGSLVDFTQVESKVIELVEWANDKTDGELSIMLYWLWFGADSQLSSVDCNLASITAQQSKFYRALQKRIGHPSKTSLVVYDPIGAREELLDFVSTALQYQWPKDGPRSCPEGKALKETVGGLLDRYQEDYSRMKDYLDGSGTAGKMTLKAKRSIPVLLLAAKRRTTCEARGIVYLGETSALRENAQAGGYFTEDPRMVEVILSQIDAHGADLPSSPGAAVKLSSVPLPAEPTS